MSADWSPGLDTSTPAGPTYPSSMVLDECLADTDTLVALDAAQVAAWSATDRTLLELCRNRVAMLLRHEPTLAAMSEADQARARGGSDASDLTECERAALDFTEQYVVDVSSLTDAQAGALREHLGDGGLVDFVNALIVVEQRMSLELIFDGVL